MPVLSCFTAFGFLEFSSAPSECEKVYKNLVASYRDPASGRLSLDLTIGTHKEAVIFGWANAIAAARVSIRRAAAELRAETAYCLLEKQEKRFGMTPGPNDTVAQRQAALAAKQKAARGPRYEAVWEALGSIFGTDLVAYRPINTAEATAYPADPGSADAPGLFRRPDGVAKSVRLLTAVARTSAPQLSIDLYDEANQTVNIQLRDGTAISGAGQSFLTGARGGILSRVRFFLKKIGVPPGTAVARLYAHTGVFGTSSLPTGSALAESQPFDVTTLSAVSYALVDFDFRGSNRIALDPATHYVVTLEYSQGTLGNVVLVGTDDTTLAHAGNNVFYAASHWIADPTIDVCFRLLGGLSMEVYYENWNRSLVEELVVKGDVLCVDPGNWGLVEKVLVTAAEGSGTSRKFTAAFARPHSAGTYATTGTTPLWTNTKRHVLVVVKASASVDPDKVTRVNELFARLMRGPTTWAVVQPSTPGATTSGPFAIGATTGSPLGAVPLESVTL